MAYLFPIFGYFVLMHVEHNYPLQTLNTFGLPGEAKTFVSCSSVADVQEAVDMAGRNGEDLFILGGGSNILLTQNPEGIVLKMDIKCREVVREDEEYVWLRAGAGENWHELVVYAIGNNLGGIENLSLIPGTAGAAPMQNIGAYGVEIEQVFDNLRAVNRETGLLETFGKEVCRFGYRESIFKREAKGKYVICDITLRLKKPPHILNTSYGAITSTLEDRGIKTPTIQDVSDAVISIRQSKLPDPAKIGNSGSFFKNPAISRSLYEELVTTYPDMPGYKVDDNEIKVPAGWLIEQCGWKGYERDGIGVHRLQALVLVNYGSGKGSDVWQLAREIQASVSEKYGIQLQPEVNVI